MRAIPGLVEALPPGVADQARDPVGVAYAAAGNAPEAARPQVLTAVADSFMRGFGTACPVVAATALAGSLFALAFLPPRPVPDVASPRRRALRSVRVSNAHRLGR